MRICGSPASTRLCRLIEVGLADPDSATAVADRAHQPRADLRLLGPRADVLGEIDRIADTGEPTAVVIQTGRWVNMLGFLNLQARETKVPAKYVLFERKAAVWLEPGPNLMRWGTRQSAPFVRGRRQRSHEDDQDHRVAGSLADQDQKDEWHEGRP